MMFISNKARYLDILKQLSVIRIDVADALKTHDRVLEKWGRTVELNSAMLNQIKDQQSIIRSLKEELDELRQKLQQKEETNNENRG
jgi:cell shape-determining protein MreC